jgi:hypothetical protein
MVTFLQHTASQDLGPIEEIPAWQRIARRAKAELTDWAKAAAWSLAESARRHTPPFEVGVAGFEGKLLGSAQVAVGYHESQVRALLAVTSLIYLRRTGLWARYIGGAMVDPIFKELVTGVSFATLLKALDVPRADILVLHTQNPWMAQALWNRGCCGFPSPGNDRQGLDVLLQEDLVEMLLTIGRPPVFDPISGLVPACYESTKPLYATEIWPLPGSEGHVSFGSLGRTDGVLVLASHLSSSAGLGLANQPRLLSLQEVAA